MSAPHHWTPEGGRVDTPAWVREATFYQVFPDRFARSPRLVPPGDLEAWDAPPTHHGFKGGDLLGVAERLEDLVDLGVTALYLNPVFSSASNHRYHTYDYFAVDPLLGGEAALRELLDRAHARGMRVVLDGVFNHVGRGFWAFHHILENGAQSPYRDWFHLSDEVLRGGRGLRAYPEDGAGGPTEKLGYAAWWGLPALPKLNTDHPGVRRMLFEVAEHWLRFGADGWRIDVPEEIPDASFWQEFRRRCRAVRPDGWIVGEIWHDARDWLAGDRFDAVMNYPLGRAILGFTAGHHLDQGLLASSPEYRAVRPMDGPAFAAEVRRLVTQYDPAVVAAQLNLVGSHDTPRFRTMAGGDLDALRLATLLQATLPGAPCVYYGDELGMEGGHDPGCRAAYPITPSPDQLGTRAFVRALLRLRRERPALLRGDLTLVAASGSTVAFRRRWEDDQVLVVCNAGDGEAEVTVAGGGRRPIPLPMPGWTPAGMATAAGARELRITMAPRSGAILHEATGRVRPSE